MVAKTPSRQLSPNFSAVAVYDMDDHDSSALANFKRVVAQLSGEKKEAFFLKDMDQQLTDDYQYTPGARAGLDILMGKHPSGFRMTMIEAEHKGKTVYMPVIDDTLLNRTLVVGPAKIAEGSAAPDIQYISATSPNAVRSINDFLAGGAYERGVREELNSASVQNLVEDIVRAIAVASNVGRIVKKGSTVGSLLVPIAKGETEVAAYSAAAKTKKPAAPKNAPRS
ncbi:MAG: hypothetical protein EPN97_13220 [Alphaproteobacteria bacterium]|nr:MAG: hypothetical protein EPN97_13220 [Alphaproteobacteria bacterium]